LTRVPSFTLPPMLGGLCLSGRLSHTLLVILRLVMIIANYEPLVPLSGLSVMTRIDEYMLPFQFPNRKQTTFSLHTSDLECSYTVNLFSRSGFAVLRLSHVMCSPNFFFNLTLIFFMPNGVYTRFSAAILFPINFPLCMYSAATGLGPMMV